MDVWSRCGRLSSPPSRRSYTTRSKASAATSLKLYICFIWAPSVMVKLSWKAATLLSGCHRAKIQDKLLSALMWICFNKPNSFFQAFQFVQCQPTEKRNLPYLSSLGFKFNSRCIAWVKLHLKKWGSCTLLDELQVMLPVKAELVLVSFAIGFVIIQRSLQGRWC